MTETGSKNGRQRITANLRRILRRVLRIGGLVVGLLLLLVAGIVLTPAGRHQLLRVALNLAGNALPGELAVERIRWADPSRIELGGCLWVDAPDTLAGIDEIVLDLRLGALRGRDLVVDELRLVHGFLDAEAVAQRFPAAAAAEADVEEATGEPKPLPWLREGSLVPLPSVAVMRAELRDIAVTGAAPGPVTLTEATLNFDLRAGTEPTADLRLRAIPQPGIGVAWALRGRWVDGIEAAVGPLRVTVLDGAEVPQPERPAHGGHVILPVATLATLFGRSEGPIEAQVDSLVVAGAAGRHRLTARIEPRRAVVEVEASWLRPPRALIPALVPLLSDSVGDRPLAAWITDVLAAWPDTLPPHFHLAVDAVLAGQGDALRPQSLAVKGRVTLPGPGILDDRLTLPVDFTGWDDLVLRLDAGASITPTDTTWTVSLDLGDSSWLDRARIVAEGTPRSVRLDTLDIALPGLALTGHGNAMAPDSFATALRLDIPDSNLLRRWRGSEGVPVAGNLRAAVTAAGSHRGLRGEATVSGALRGAELDLPAFTAIATLVGSSGEIEVALPRGLTVGTFAADSLALHVAGDLPDSAGHGSWRVVTVVDTPLAGMNVAARIEHIGKIVADVDSLRLRSGTRSLRSKGPFRIAVDPGDSTLSITDLDLAGGMGRLAVNGVLAADTLGAEIRADLRLNTANLASVLPPEKTSGWPLGDLDIEIDAGFSGTPARPEGQLALTTALEAEAGRPRLSFSLEGHLQPGGVEVSGSLAVADTQAATLAAQVPMQVGLRPILVTTDPGDSLRIDLRTDLSLAAEDLVELISEEQILDLPDGRIGLSMTGRLRGTFHDPRGAIEMDASYSSQGDRPPLTMKADGRLAEGLGSGQVDVDIGDERVLSLRARYPLRFELAPFAFAPQPEDTIVVDLTGEQVALATLDPWLPPGWRSQGQLDLRLSMSGTGDSPAVDGGIALTNVQLRHRDGSWFALGGNVGFGGTVAETQVDGRFEVEGGLIRIPEIPPQLHPTEGSALLWQVADPGSEIEVLSPAALADTVRSRRAARLTEVPTQPDSTAGAPVPAAADTTPRGIAPAPSAGSAFLPTIAVDILFPGNLWLRGHGLDIELEGDLTTYLQSGRPTLGGSLLTRRGQFRLLGRTFEVERGYVIFYADDPTLNPDLDVSLVAQLGSTTYRVEIQGRAQRPLILLTSEPPMPEADIVASLLFGKPVNELDSGEEQLVRDRSREMLAAFGSTVLSDKLSRQLGVDVVTLKAATGNKDKSALMVGKYLNPNLMVQYEQVLSDRAEFFVRLEYALTRFFKVESIYAQGADSGIELKWSRDY